MVVPSRWSCGVVMLPNFIGIGAQRAGSTWLYACLREHPQVYVPPEKELHFFNAHFDRGLNWYKQQFPPPEPPEPPAPEPPEPPAPESPPPEESTTFRVSIGPTDLRASEASIGEASGASGAWATAAYRAVGEITPGYLDHDLAIGRIAAAIPDVKLFVVLREPAQRAYSAYRLFKDRYQDWTFAQACQRGQDLVRLGCYAQHLTRVFKHFPRQQVKVFLYEDLVDQPHACLAGLLRFLSVDPGFVPKNMTQRYNRVLYPKTQALLARWRMTWAVDAVKATPIGAWFRNQKNSPQKEAAQSADPDREMAQVRAMFRDDVRQLQTLIDRDLSSWLD